MKTTMMGWLLASALAGGVALAAVPADVPAALLAHARIKLPEARAIALKARPGAIVKEELEEEKGGSGLRYSFDIKAGQHVWEVGVDAATGKVLENQLDDNAKD